MQFNLKKILFITGISLAAILLVGFLLIYVFLPYKVTSVIKKEITQSLHDEQTTNYYIVEVSKVKFNRFFQQLHIPDIYVALDPQVFLDSLYESMPKNYITISLENINISTPGLVNLARKKDNVKLTQFSIERVKAITYQNPEGTKPDNDKEKDKEKNNELPENISIENFNIQYINLESRLLSDTSQILHFISDANIAGDIYINSPPNDSIPQIEVTDYTVNAKKLQFQQGLYRYSLDSLILDDTSKNIQLSQFRMEALYSREEFSRHITYQTDHMDVSVNSLEIQGFELNPLINKQFFNSTEIIINEGIVKVYRDRNLPFNTSQRPALPTKLIREAPYQFNIDKTTIKNLDILYSELPEGGTNTGDVPFRNLQASIENITNISEQLQKDSMMHINANANSFDNSSLNASFHYNLNDINGGFRANVELSNFDFRKLNSVLDPLVGIEIDKGIHRKSTLTFSGNDFHSSGTLIMLYSDLDITLEPERSDFRQNVVGWAARNFLYFSANPSNNNEPRKGKIDFERDPSRFVFHYWWNSYLSGIKNTILRENINL